MLEHEHIMVDIEILGTRVGSVIAQIGAVKFDPHTLRDDVMDSLPFNVNIDIDSCLERGLDVDGSTIRWWLGQSKQARESLIAGPFAKLENVLFDLKTWCGSEFECVWSHGVTFDLMLLNEAYYVTAVIPAWTYRQMRDTRTLFDLCNKDDLEKVWHHRPEDKKHIGIYDAYYQALNVKEAYRLIMDGKVNIGA